MKSFRIDDNEAVSPDRVAICALDASKRKRTRKDVQKRLRHLEDTITAVQAIVEQGAYSPRHHEAVVINQNGPHKERTIIKPDYFPEQIIHHIAVNALQPCIMYGMSDFVLGSIPGRGAHYGKRYIEKWLRHDERNTRIIGKLDIRHFYQSIDHDVLKGWLHEKIRPGKIRDLCDLIIDGVKEGIPLGFYTSQWFSNFLLQPLDHLIMEKLHVSYACRYVDDITLFGGNKKVIHAAMEEIDRYLWENFHLQVKHTWQVFRMEYTVTEYAIECQKLADLYALDKVLPVAHRLKMHHGRRKIFVRASSKGEAVLDEYLGKYGATAETVRMTHGRPLDFMGFEFHRDRTILRKSIMIRATRKASRLGGTPRINWAEAAGMLSYMGWIDHTDTYAMYVERVKPYIDIKRLKRIVSNHQRRLNNGIQNRPGLPAGEAAGAGSDLQPGQGLPAPQRGADHRDRPHDRQGDPALAI